MRRLAFAFCWVIMFVGCAQQVRDGAADVQVKLEHAPDPPRVGVGKVIVHLQTADGTPMEKARVKLEGNMNHAGMKPSFADAQETAPGRYEASLDFTMRGDWFILVEGELPDGRSLRRKIDVRGVRDRKSVV